MSSSGRGRGGATDGTGPLTMPSVPVNTATTRNSCSRSRAAARRTVPTGGGGSRRWSFRCGRSTNAAAAARRSARRRRGSTAVRRGGPPNPRRCGGTSTPAATGRRCGCCRTRCFSRVWKIRAIWCVTSCSTDWRPTAIRGRSSARRRTRTPRGRWSARPGRSGSGSCWIVCWTNRRRGGPFRGRTAAAEPGLPPPSGWPAGTNGSGRGRSTRCGRWSRPRGAEFGPARWPTITRCSPNWDVSVPRRAPASSRSLRPRISPPATPRSPCRAPSGPPSSRGPTPTRSRR